MNCQTCRERMPEFADKRLDKALASDMGAHIASCPGCSAEFESIRATLGVLDALEPAPPSHRMRARLMGDIESEKLGQQAAQSWDPVSRGAARRGPRGWWVYALQAAAALALVAGGFMMGERSASQRQLADLRARVDTMGQLVEQSVLQKQATGVRLETVLTAATTRKPDDRLIDGLINSMAFDTSVNVRLNALNALYAHSDQEVVRAGVIACLRRETNPLVQVSMIDFLVGSRAREAAPELRKLAADEHADADVRESARRATDLL